MDHTQYIHLLQYQMCIRDSVYIPEDENVFPMVPGGARLDQMILQDTLD